MSKVDDRNSMENNPGVPPFMRRWAKEVNLARANKSGGWYTTTITTTTTTTTA